MSVKITDNMPTIGARVASNVPLAIRFMLEDIHQKANPKTPKDKGDLRMNVLKEVKGNTGKITWKQNYAIYQGRKQYVNYTTPGTGPFFDTDAISEVIPKVKQYLKKSRVIQ